MFHVLGIGSGDVVSFLLPLLPEAEIKTDGKAPGGRAENDSRIGAACREANIALNSVLSGWNLSIESHYPL
jgi:hypothetical protein